MRENKFRYWDKFLKGMFYSDKWIWEEWESHFKRVGNNEILMQFTGLRDENGTEIYEGDIIKQELYGGLSVSHSIKWYDDGACFGYDSRQFSHSDITKEKAGWFEVVGNIWEHKELLEKK